MENFFGGSVIAVIIFAILLLCALLFLRYFCIENNVDDIVDLSKKLFGRGSLTFLWMVSLCLFCIVIALFSTTADCLELLFGSNTNLPIYQCLTAVICCAISCAGKNTIEMVARILLPICIVFVICANLFGNSAHNLNSDTKLTSGAVYALYSFVPAISIVSKNKPAKSTILLSTIILAVLCCIQLATTNGHNGMIPTLQAVEGNKFLYTWGVAAIYLSGLTSLLLCSMPVWAFLGQIIDDRATVIGSTTILAVALSNFGFGAVATICYPMIALVGLATLIALLLQLNKKRTKKKARLSLAPSKRKIKENKKNKKNKKKKI